MSKALVRWALLLFGGVFVLLCAQKMLDTRQSRYVFLRELDSDLM